jgi:hypothetical protein
MEILETHNHNGPETFTESLTIQLLGIWPHLKPLFDNNQACLIYAGFHPEFSFFTRRTDGIKNQIINEYNSGKRHFLFECLGEGVSSEVITKIHSCTDELMDQYNDLKVYFLTGTIDGEQSYRIICNTNQLNPYITILACNYFLYINAKSYPKYNIDYSISNREKNFVCLNKVHRQHRIDLLELMLRENLINDKCYYSFYDSAFSSEGVLQSLLIDDYPHIVNNLEFIKTLRLNFDDTRQNPVDIREEDLKLFINSYFSVVTETLFHSSNYDFLKGKRHISNVHPGIFITEKTTKVLALKHPFILASVPNMLSALRNAGYKTFHPYIDETYDTIKDDDLRLLYVVNEVKRLCNQTDTEWLEWTKNIKPIVEHNYRHFFNCTDYTY